MPSLEARLARNEVMFRAVNCECADETCVERVIGIAAHTVREPS